MSQNTDRTATTSQKSKERIYPLGNPLIPYGTPLHVTELLLQLFKLTFAEFPENHPFHYENDFEKTGIAFDVSLNRESDIFGKKPLVIVARGGQNVSPVIIGDLAQSMPRIGEKHGSTLYNGMVNITIVSRNKGECEIIAQHLFSILTMARTHFPGAVCMHMLQAINLSEVVKMEDDDAMYMAQITVNYVGQYIWRQHENDPLLRSIKLAVKKLNDTPPNHCNSSNNSAADINSNPLLSQYFTKIDLER